MAAPFARTLLGFRPDSRDPRPNISDKASNSSRALSEHILASLGVPSSQVFPKRHNAGKRLEEAVAEHLATELPGLDDDREWLVESGCSDIATFAQYQHLLEVRTALRRDAALRNAFSGEYEFQPDVTVALDAQPPSLHAHISCKWTLRSDRAQSVRQEASLLINQRRGRSPHIVVVTAEPLPSRISSIAQGTGDIDAVYHIAFNELRAAAATSDYPDQEKTLEELISQRRLLDYNDLAPALAV